MRAQALAQRLVGIEALARLVEVDDAQRGGALDAAGVGCQFAGQQAQKCGLANAVAAQQAQARAGREGEAQVAKQCAAAQRLGDFLDGDQALGTAVGGGEIDLRHALRGTRFHVGQFADEAAGLASARARFPGARLGAAAQPLHFPTDRIGQRFLAAGLRQQEGFLGFEKVAVAASTRRMPSGYTRSISAMSLTTLSRK